MKPLCIISKEILTQKILSSLVIYAQGMEYRLSLAPVEVYSAGYLWFQRHEQVTVPINQRIWLDKDCATVYISSSKSQHLDSQDLLHAAQPGLLILQHNLDQLEVNPVLIQVFVEVQDGRQQAHHRLCKDVCWMWRLFMG